MIGEIEFARMLRTDVVIAALALAGSYTLGCLNAAYYFVRWRTGGDIRAYGSSNAGATNAGRLLGRRGFSLVFALDSTKGAIAVGLARWLQLDLWSSALVVIVVVAGHVWPVQLGFRGGKGIATSLGAMLVFEPRLICTLAALCTLLFAFLRRPIFSGLLAFALTPLVWLAFRPPLPALACISGVTLIVLFSHRSNLTEEWRRWRRAASIRSATQTSSHLAE